MRTRSYIYISEVLKAAEMWSWLLVCTYRLA